MVSTGAGHKIVILTAEPWFSIAAIAQKALASKLVAGQSDVFKTKCLILQPALENDKTLQVSACKLKSGFYEKVNILIILAIN